MDKGFSKEGHSKELNLRAMAQEFMDGLQRHADMLAFNLASRESVQEVTYKKRSAAPQIMPSGKRHQNFEQMQAYARDLLVRQVINDCLGLAVTALNNSHFFFSLLKESKGSNKFAAGAQQIAEERHQHFLKAPIHVKFDLLHQHYGVRTDQQPTILNLVIALKALIENNGILKAGMFPEGVNPVLEIDLKRLEVEQTKNEDGKAMGRIVNDRKVFRDGEAIVFSDLEIQRTLVTIASFADALFKSVAGYAQSFNKKG
ncbi:MAG: hypothetical protein O2827_03360 [Verrucomicrobia bacterium]|nr:hypothetical protein [Verrucomicrobiota bacterium]